MIGQTVTIKSGSGAWDITSFPLGGKFRRFSDDTQAVVERDYFEEGYTVKQTKGTRYIVKIDRNRYAISQNALW